MILNDIKPDEVHCKLQNYIIVYTLWCSIWWNYIIVYTLWCSICRWKYYTIESKNKHSQRRKSECEISIDHYKNVCKNATFSIHIIEKLPENGYENWVKDYWMKTSHIVYRYGLNERIKFMNKDSAKLFLPLPRYDERFIDIKTCSKITTHDLSFDIEIFFIF